MLTISPIRNVQSTINNNISFKAGVRINSGADVVNNTADVQHEGSFFTDFLGTIGSVKSSVKTFWERQNKIEQGLDAEERKINAIA